MTKQITLEVSDAVYDEMNTVARQSGRDVATMLMDVLVDEQPWLHVSPEREAMLRERKAFFDMLPELLTQYPQEFVAVLDGQVVDHDEDKIALLKRREDQFPNQPVFIRQVLPQFDDTLHMRSPRFVR